ncbi:up-regulator of cell proliferation-like [Conger conger]|uniref:up-regulator of cell proliferation-like n=1 Tax=Conger conger TaxID=82655 RepID=UPI002A5A525A|nr:up-regulator of cell proliferation-like [Conger conger]
MTGTSLEELLSDLGLEHHLRNKLTLSQVLQIDGETLSDENIQSLKSLPWCFLRKLMMVNESFRRMSCTSEQDTEPQNLDSLLSTEHNPQDHSNRVNPLDLITAVFLCSDGFLQQEMALKMSMCQFSVPLLLPTCDTQQCTLMLWAMRDIVKKYKPHSLEDQRGFVEESIVLSDLPMVSFVRLGNSSMSKSHILNQVLSNPQQYQDTFVHKNMECGDTPRKISNGLVEISWYLPSGNKQIDIFSEPLAIANLRGDLRDFETQYAFLCRTSTAIFVFCDDFKLEHKFLDSQHFKTPWFLIINSQSQSFNEDDFKKFVSETKPSNIIIKHWGRNDAEFNKNLRLAIQGILEGNIKMSIERMSALAYELGIHVDENYIHCKRGKQKADEITGRISDIPSFKEKELPLQGTAWKQLAKLEKEQCRMKNAEEKNIEVYKNELADQRQELREQQRAHSISDSMSRFISAMCNSTEECKYFLKWMRINLDNLSRKSLPPLWAKYKEECQSSSENKELIAQLDREISSCSLGTEHFLREMGQLYESACSLPKALTPEIKRLPRLCAKLLQEGFPLELVDGDSSNIPLEWVTQVLKELHDLTQDKCKIRVITVLGIQSTGKSTLLNTMSGVQFAVSSGRCTRGAFMLLIRVKEDFKVRLGCDYIMVIDTEGLKAPQLAQLDDSHEHDNELATLVVGLSDITVINIPMENSMEMNDILQIVVHAFLRMKEVGRKPCCQFVHQNVPDISAHDSNMRDRKLLLEQLNEMTQAAAKMEKKGNNKTFTDVMEYDPERNTWYLPGLWHGNPPMAPVNAKLKIHICGHAAREFKRMHLAFIHANDPRHCLEQFKQQYYTDFKDLFNKRDQCQKKANDFTSNCLQPAVKEYITKSLGPDLVDEMLAGQKAIAFSTRTFFQFSVLEQLLKGDNFQDFVRYIKKYETFVHDWILKLMVKQFSERDRLGDIEMNRLKVMLSRIKEAIKNAQMKAAEQAARRGEETQNIQQFIQDICSDLAKELVIPKDPLSAVLALNSAKAEEFSRCLEVLVDEMEQSGAEFQKGGDVRARLTSLPFQPQKELFNRVFGCGKRCPFCKLVREADGMPQLQQ